MHIPNKAHEIKNICANSLQKYFEYIQRHIQNPAKHLLWRICENI